jgi:hypothetical protein
VVRELEIDPIAGQGINEIGEEPGRDGNGALFLYLAANPAADGDLQIGGGELKARAICDQEDIIGDG